jgi:hypothetical protein
LLCPAGMDWSDPEYIFYPSFQLIHANFVESKNQGEIEEW